MREWLLPQADGSVDHQPGRRRPRAGAGGRTSRRGRRGLRGRARCSCPAGRRLRPGDLAAAAAGRARVGGRGPAAGRSRSSRPGTRSGRWARCCGPGEIFDTNSLMLAARCRQLGAVPVVSDVQPDDPDALAAEIRRAAARRRPRARHRRVKPRARRPRRPPCSPRSAASPWPGSRSAPVTPRCSATPSGRGRAASPRRSTGRDRPGDRPARLPARRRRDLRAVRGAAARRARRAGARPPDRACCATLDRDWTLPARHRGLGAGDARPAAEPAAGRRGLRASRRDAGQARRRARSASSPAPTPGGRCPPMRRPSPRHRIERQPDPRRRLTAAVPGPLVRAVPRW